MPNLPTSIYLTLLAGKHRTGKLAKIPKMSMISLLNTEVLRMFPCHGFFAGKGQTSSPRVMGQDGPSTKRQVEWGRFLRELGAEIPVLQDFAGEEAMGRWGPEGWSR